MSWTNYHSHSLYCDGKAPLEAFVKEAIEIGLTKLGFSGHGPVPVSSVWNMSEADWPEYLSEVERLKSEYGQQIELYSGVEADYIQGKLSANDAIFTDANLDFIIGSLHFMGTLDDGSPWTIDGPPAEWDAGMQQLFSNDVYNVLQDFCNQSIEMINAGGFDILGHMDKSFQHAHKYIPVDDPKHVACTLDMLSAARDADLVVEINTKSYAGLGFFYPHQYFFKALKEWKIPVTINADTHHPKQLTASYEVAAQMLLDVGIKETVELMNGEWQPCGLSPKGIVLPK